MADDVGRETIHQIRWLGLGKAYALGFKDCSTVLKSQLKLHQTSAQVRIGFSTQMHRSIRT